VRSSPSPNCSISSSQPTPKCRTQTPTITNEKEPPPEVHLHRTWDPLGPDPAARRSPRSGVAVGPTRGRPHGPARGPLAQRR
jgi:hypothetical protein